MMAGLLVLVACGGNPDQQSAGDSGGALGDGGDDGSTQDSTVSDATSDTGGGMDGTMLAESGEASVTEGGGSGEAASPEAGGAEAGNEDAGAESGLAEASTPDSGATVEAGVEAGIQDAAAEAASPAESGAPDAAPEASVCTVAGIWSITVQTTTAVPTLCQGVLDCTNCDVQSNATATQPTSSTIQWTLDPGGTLCNNFTGTVSPTGAFSTGETDCSPIGDGTTFDGQINLASCSMTATYVYVLNSSAGTCTITYTITGTQ